MPTFVRSRRRFLRPSLLAALTYAGLSLALVSPALVPGRTLSASDALWDSTPWKPSKPPGVRALGSNSEIGDQFRFFQPFLLHTRGTLPHIPLWNPHLMAGRPFLGNGQSSIFSPFSVPAYVLPFWRSLAITAALKLFVAAFGTYLLGRALGMGFAGGLLAGLVFAFSLWYVAWLSWPHASVWAFLPWLWLLADRVVRGADLLGLCALASVVGLQYLAGHPQSSFHVLAFTGLFALIRLVQLRSAVGPGVRSLARRLAAFAGAIVLGTALAALTLIPLMELLAQSADVSDRAKFSDTNVSPRYLLALFLHDYWGRPTRTGLSVDSAMHGRAFFVGAFAPMLAVTALIVRVNFERIALAVVGAFSLLVVFGAEPAVTIVKALPGFGIVANTRLAVVFVLCAALLAGWGLDDLVERREALKKKRVILALAVVVLATPIVWMTAAGHLPPSPMLGEAFDIAWGFASPPRTNFFTTASEMERIVDEIRVASLLEWLVPAVAAIGLLALRLAGRLRAAAFAALAVLLVVADLFKAGMGLNPAISIQTAVQPLTPALRYLRDQRPNRFVGLNPTHPFAIFNPLLTNQALTYGLFDARGYDFPVEERFKRFWRREIAGGDCAYYFCTSGAPASPRALRALGLLSVTDLLQDPIDEIVRAPGLRVAYDGRDGRVYSNVRALPRVFVVDHQVVVPSPESALRALGSSTFRPRRAAITETKVLGVSEGMAGETSTLAGSARLVSYGAERAVVQAISRRSSLLVLTDTFFPGWKATVDGKSAPIHRIDYLLRGVRLDSGRHRVEFRYEPASWRVGRIVSAVALMMLLALAILGWRRREARVSTHGPQPSFR